MRRALIALIALGLGTTACGGSSKATSLAVTVTEPAAGRVEMVAPGSVKGGAVEVTLKNSGKAAHDAQLIRVEGNHSQSEVLDIVGSENSPIPTWLHAEGGVGTVGPGQSLSATMRLPAGSYYIVDTNSDENNNSFAKAGGVRTLTVTGGGSGDLPKAGTTITAREYGFAVPKNLKAGTSNVKFQNVGKELHLLVAVPIVPGKTIDDVRQALSSQDSSAPPPVDFEKATGSEVLDGGKSLVTRMTFERGSYAFICFLNDRAGGPPHFTLGMLQEVKVA
jgi:hypothetical protein